MDWICQLTDIIKRAPSTSVGWEQMLSLFSREQPSELWAALPRPDALDDVGAAAVWLGANLHGTPDGDPVRGVYLGLDTMNMNLNEPYNLEIAVTANCDPHGPADEWPYHCEWYGEKHLIASLQAIKEAYDCEEYQDLYSLADYGVILGYSGLVLAEALGQIKPPPETLLAVWGFHDGDLFRLARRTPSGVERICEVI